MSSYDTLVQSKEEQDKEEDESSLAVDVSKSVLINVPSTNSII